MHEASLALNECLNLMGGSQELADIAEKVDIDGEAAVETIEIIWRKGRHNPALCLPYAFIVGAIAARKAIGREEEEAQAEN
jgi:hypothetical protein